MDAQPLRLNLGCGNKRREGFIGVDIGAFDAVDVRQDVLSYLRSLGDATVQEIYSRHFLEHLEPPALQELLAQVDRVVRPGGRIHFIVPHFSNPYFHSDPTHRQAFGVHTFSYLCERTCLRRHVPAYARRAGWTLSRVKVGFLPYEHWHLFGRRMPMLSDLLNRVVNRSSLRIELFERYLCGVLSIYEVEFFIDKAPAASAPA
jgi:SAM-dependent methyltransferase